jgi:hypothetical protein
MYLVDFKLLKSQKLTINQLEVEKLKRNFDLYKNNIYNCYIYSQKNWNDF